MSNIYVAGPVAQLPPSTMKAITDFGEAIRNLDGVIVRLVAASRLAAQIKNPHAPERAYLVGALEPEFETLKLVEMCFCDMFPED